MQVSGYEDEYKKVLLLLHISDTEGDQNIKICAHLTVNATCFYKTVIFRIANMICNLQFFTSIRLIKRFKIN